MFFRAVKSNKIYFNNSLTLHLLFSLIHYINFINNNKVFISIMSDDEG